MKMMPHVLVVEDEPELRSTIISFLDLSGFSAAGVGDIAGYSAWISAHACDLIVLDLGLPDGDGLEIAKQARSTTDCGIVVVTARGSVDDRLEGYQVGADHYLVKPVDLRELVVVLRAVDALRQRALCIWLFDPIGWKLVAPSGPEVRLTRSEVQVLKKLAESPGTVVTKQVLAEALGFDYADYDERRLEILFRRLRRKVLDSIGVVVPIETVHAMGYAFTAKIKFI